ncbi:MAG TPA: hypothetical protein VF267_00850, partial [Gammaproteobacteria bacterium]
NAHDYDMIEQIYAHVDSYNSFTSSGGGDGGDGGDGGGCNAPPGKGCNKMDAPRNVPMGLLVHKSGHHEVYVAEREDGGYWVHHVLVAPEPGKSH